MRKPDFSIIKDQANRSFFEYVWKRIDREYIAIERMREGKDTFDPGKLADRMDRYNKWTAHLFTYMSALKGELPMPMFELQKDFAEHNSNPSGSDGMFKRTSVDA